MLRPLTRSCLLPVALVGLALAILTLSQQIGQRYPNTSLGEDPKYLPSGKFLKGAALTYDEVLADLLWIKAIGYFGAHAKTDQDYTWLYHLLDITTTLDPLYADPYEFGGIVLASELHEVDQSIAILRKGMANVPPDNKRYWYLPFYSAFNYMYYKGDNLTAARLLEKAAESPGRPEYLPLLVARLYANTNDPEVAIPFLEEMIRQATSPEMQETLHARIREILVTRDIHRLEQARDRFLAEQQRYPATLDDLVREGFIKQLPDEPNAGRYGIDPSDHAIYSTKGQKLKLFIDKTKQPPAIKVTPR